VENDEGFSDMKDKKEIERRDEVDAMQLPQHDCSVASFQPPNPKVVFDQDSRNLVIVSYDSFEITYCPFCGRHAEEIALEFVDDEDLEVPESGS